MSYNPEKLYGEAETKQVITIKPASMF